MKRGIDEFWVVLQFMGFSTLTLYVYKRNCKVQGRVDKNVHGTIIVAFRCIHIKCSISLHAAER